jgi:hypothetical protein
MIIDGDGTRDLSSLRVLRCGGLEATGDPFEPYQVADAGGVVVAPVAAYLRDLQACGRPAATQRSYAMDLLRWFRPINCTMSLIFSQADRLVCQRSMVWSRTYDVP